MGSLTLEKRVLIPLQTSRADSCRGLNNILSPLNRCEAFDQPLLRSILLWGANHGEAPNSTLPKPRPAHALSRAASGHNGR